MSDKRPVLSVVDGKICIDGRPFEHTELREIKKYLLGWHADDRTFVLSDDLSDDGGKGKERSELFEIIIEMGHLCPESSAEEALAYFLASTANQDQ